MINLDHALAPYQDPAAYAGWSGDRAKKAADTAAAEAGYAVTWEPGDEEWVLLADDTAYQAMVSIRYPLALATPTAAVYLRGSEATLTLVEITDFLTEDLEATPELLKMTVLPYGWADDFNPGAFCANDLFVESV
ncbi:hypothetical protein AB0H43_13320 [Hamadaea sp. NPDC050747]|uniref:hypothetical protein n=1 Tax=Hamadaea sp. NPDC050747 TaxID=3155789 RepID=UPI0033C24558